MRSVGSRQTGLDPRFSTIRDTIRDIIRDTIRDTIRLLGLAWGVHGLEFGFRLWGSGGSGPEFM